jgi:hypothetical protein
MDGRYVNKLEALNYVLLEETEKLRKENEDLKDKSKDYEALKEKAKEYEYVKCVNCEGWICPRCNDYYLNPYCSSCGGRICDDCLGAQEEVEDNAPGWCPGCEGSVCIHCGDHCEKCDRDIF